MELLVASIASGSVVLWILSSFFFLPLTQDPYAINQFYLLGFASLLAVIAWSISLIRTHELVIRNPKLSLVLGLLTFAGFLSVFVSSGNKIEGLLSLLGPATFLYLTILTLTLPGYAHAKIWQRISTILATLLAVITLWQALGFGKLLLPVLPFLSDPNWTPTGSTLATVSIYLLSLPLLLENVWQSYGKKSWEELAGEVLSLTLVVAAVGISGYHLVLNWTSNTLPLSAGWAVALEALKNPGRLLSGVGPEGYPGAFTLGKPLGLNLTPLWSATFVMSSSYFLHLLTTLGLLGGILAGWLAVSLVRLSLASRKTYPFASASPLVLVMLFLLTSPSLPVLIFGLLVSVLATGETQVRTIKLGKPAAIVTSVVLMVATGVTGYFLGRVWYSEMLIGRAINQAQAGKGNETYQTQIKAIKLYPYSGRYHQILSRTSLALAQSILNNSKNDLTKMNDVDKKTVGDLLSQAVREAKLDVQLESTNPRAWENLADLYGQLIPLAPGSRQWAITSYQKAIQLDPANPQLHIKLGGVYMTEKSYDLGIEEFRAAAFVKNDLANAYYNLANAYRTKGDPTNERLALEKTLTLIPTGTSDAAAVQNQLNALPKITPTPTP